MSPETWSCPPVPLNSSWALLTGCPTTTVHRDHRRGPAPSDTVPLQAQGHSSKRLRKFTSSSYPSLYKETFDSTDKEVGIYTLKAFTFSGRFWTHIHTQGEAEWSASICLPCLTWEASTPAGVASTRETEAGEEAQGPHVVSRSWLEPGHLIPTCSLLRQRHLLVRTSSRHI